ncbi:hypothetical protein D3C76_1698820 [compost metagenome]
MVTLDLAISLDSKPILQFLYERLETRLLRGRRGRRQNYPFAFLKQVCAGLRSLSPCSPLFGCPIVHVDYLEFNPDGLALSACGAI